MEKRWSLKPEADKNKINDLSVSLNINNCLANLLCQRGINSFEEARLFFRPEISQLHDPFLMKDMDKAITRIELAISKKENILIYGDYDVDGTTAVSLVVSFMRKYCNDALIDYYIPDRYAEGYGISTQSIDWAQENKFSLIIALDCGIKSLDKIDYANTKKIDFIICDHHRPGDEIPNAVAVLDPKRSDCGYPYKELSGCGIGLKLIQAIAISKKLSINCIEDFFDLAAISIAADIVPITGENRILAALGIKKINTNPSTGIKALLEIANVKKELSITDIVFTIGPRINAAGRLESGKKAVNLLLAEDNNEAIELGTNIQKTNVNRQALDKNITIEALQMIIDKGWESRMSTVLFNPDWHKGVVGIVASRLTETYYRPTIMLTESQGVATGSARSVKDFDVYEAIDACSDLLIQFGGHKYAAGLTLESSKVNAFVEKFENIVSATIDKKLLIPEIEIDSELSFEEITPKFYNILKQFAPFGPENMNPVFKTTNVKIKGEPKVVGENHLKLDLVESNNPAIVFPAIGFNLAKYLELCSTNQSLQILYSIEENEWNHKKTIQLNIKDIKPQ